MGGIFVDISCDIQRHSAERCCLQCEMKTFFRTDPAERDNVVLLDGRRLKFLDWNSVFNHCFDSSVCWTIPPLGLRNAYQVCIGSRNLKCLRRIPAGWKVQGDDDRNAWGWQIIDEINPVQVDQVNRILLQHPY